MFTLAILSTFWDFNIGHAVVLTMMLGQFLWWIIKYDRRINDTVTSLAQLKTSTEKTFAELIERINQIDEKGTRKSQQALTADEKITTMNAARIEKLENITTEWIPRLAAGLQDVHWISDWIRNTGMRKLENGD